MYKGKIKCTFAELFDSAESGANKLCSIQQQDFKGYVVLSELSEVVNASNEMTETLTSLFNSGNSQTWDVSGTSGKLRVKVYKLADAVYDKFPYLKGKDIYINFDSIAWSGPFDYVESEDVTADAQRKQNNSILLGVAAAAALLLLLRK